jgi:hypothetical protein
MLTTDNNNGIYKQMDNKQTRAKDVLLELGRSFIYSLLWVGAAYGVIKSNIEHLQSQVAETKSSFNAHVIDDVNRHEFNGYTKSVDDRFQSLDSKLDLIITLIDK